MLWIIQHLFGSIEAMLDTIHLYFDLYETPGQFLPWLAGSVGDDLGAGLAAGEKAPAHQKGDGAVPSCAARCAG